MIFHAAKKHTPNLNRIIQSLENTKFRKKKALKMYQFCLEFKKNPCKGEIPLANPPDAKASKRHFAPVPPTYNKISV